jgi:hypothetical protein
MVIGLIIAIAIAGCGGILTFLFRKTIGAWLFPIPPSVPQQMVDKQKKMDNDILNPPDKNKTINDLNNGTF